MTRKMTLAISIITFLFILSACTPEKETPQDELLIYCGVTMIRPMTDLAKDFENDKKCKIIITKGGSGNLLKSIKTNMVGDLYLPGSETYINDARNNGLITQTALVGFNKASMMTLKGNPLNIPENLTALSNSSFYVVIGNPRSGSIGLETKTILTRFGNYEQVIQNARKLTTDSKDLIRVLKDKEADLVINWYAPATWDDNKNYVDVLPISEEFAYKKKLILAVLKSSKHKQLANEFLKFAASPKGKEIFNKYGLYDIR